MSRHVRVERGKIGRGKIILPWGPRESSDRERENNTSLGLKGVIR